MCTDGQPENTDELLHPKTDTQTKWAADSETFFISALSQSYIEQHLKPRDNLESYPGIYLRKL